MSIICDNFRHFIQELPSMCAAVLMVVLWLYCSLVTQMLGGSMDVHTSSCRFCTLCNFVL